MARNDEPTRRQFIRTGVSAVTAAAVAHAAEGRQADGRAPSGDMPTRLLGRTGERVSLIGLGGSHIGQQDDEQESIRIIRTAIDRGVTFLDNSWDYHAGASEARMGKALREGYRQRVFLMTKIDGRTRQAAAEQIEQSLKRLQTDHVDLLQFHEVIRMTDPERIFGPDGALGAVLDAKKAGKVRFVGFTGHKSPDIHLRMFEVARAHGFQFDTVQMPLNVMDAHFESFQHKVLPVAREAGAAVLAMKPMGDKIILESKAVTPVECLHYAMSLPVSVVITGCDSLPVLEQAIAAARSYRPPSESEVAVLLARTTAAARDGWFEKYKTSHTFDSTVQHPEWLG